MAKTTTFPKTTWDTLHKNGPFPLKNLHITELEGEGNLPIKTDRYNDVAIEIQRLIKKCAENGEGFRAFGARWSMSHIAHQKDNMHFNSNMNIKLPVFEQDLHPQSSYQGNNLFFFECGNKIKEISQFLGTHGKSLKTSGASNGQTIAGCISTGVHGSAIDVGSVQDYVVGLNLIIGPNPSDIIYIERHTKPALHDDFARKIKARVIRNDALFNAALVGLGSFGFIHGVVIEAEDRFLLKRYIKKIKKEVALELAESMDFENSVFKIPEEVTENGKGKRPYHYKIFINQYNDKDDYIVELLYKKRYRINYPDPFPVMETSIYRDLIYLLIKISEKFPKSIPWFIKRLKNEILPDVNEVTEGTLYETFWDAPYKGPAFACSFGVDHKDSAKALKLLTELTINEGPIPGIFAMRFVKKSQATLAFTRFPITCMIEIDGVLWKKSKKLMSLKEYSRRMIAVLKSNHIPFTIHWGKNTDWSFPGLVPFMYREHYTNWKKIRMALLTDEMSKLFSNDFLEDTNLFTQPIPEIEEESPEDLIVSLL